MTSDHFPVCGLVTSKSHAEAECQGSLRVSKEKLPDFVRAVSQWISAPQSLVSTSDVERYAEAICQALTDGLKAFRKRRIQGSGRSAPWWTPKCKEAHLNYRSAYTEEERTTYAKILRSTVASAKREHWKKRIETMRSCSDVYKMMRWAAPKHQKIPPPLRHDGKLVSDQAERAMILRDLLLDRHSETDDLPPCTRPAEPRNPWFEEISELEAQSCTIGGGNTCPGADGISVELLAACWSSIGRYITQLFQACLRLGYHPACFKLAEVIFLPKSGRDL